MVDITALTSKIVSTIFPNGVGAINAADHQSMLLQIADAIGENSQEITELSERSQENETFIEDLQNTKIDKEADDYYPQLSVGLADNLAGVDVVASEVSFRRSGGGAISDGVARIEAIKGNSVVWNQKVRNVLDTTGAEGWWKRENTQLSLDGNKIIMATGASGLTMMSQKVGFIENHKYLIAFDVEVVTELEAISLVLLQSGDLYGGSQRVIAGFLQKDALFASFYTASADMPYIAIYHQVYLNEGDTTTFDGIKVIDLTQMFGVGNEPTTIDEFNARKPLGIDENAYNEGEVIHMDAQSLESVGVNQWDEEWEVGEISGTTGVDLPGTGNNIRTGFIRVIPNFQYYISIQGKNRLFARARLYDADKNFIGITSASGADINTNEAFTIPSNAHYIRFAPQISVVAQSDLFCINLSDPSINGKYYPYIKRVEDLSVIRKYFPEGMKSARAAHDEIRYNKAKQKWETVQIGEVDMGSFNWRYASVTDTSSSVSYDVFFAFDIQDICKLPAANSIANILSNKYITTLNTAVANRVMEDKSIMLYRNGAIYIRDTAYTDTATFKAAMQGVMLYYELAEPIVTELDDDFNLDYEVWNGGTEKILTDVPTTPLKADITYGFNAIGKIKELESLVAQLRAKVGI